MKQNSLRLHLIRECCVIKFPSSKTHFCTGVINERVALSHSVCHSTHRTTPSLPMPTCQPQASAERRWKSLSTKSYHSGWMFPIKQLNQPPSDSFHRHLGNYRSLLFTSGDRTAGAVWLGVGSEGMENKETGVTSVKMKGGM